MNIIDELWKDKAFTFNLIIACLMGPPGVLMCDKLTKYLMCFECLCLSCNRLMLRDTKELEQRNAQEQKSKRS